MVLSFIFSGKTSKKQEVASQKMIQVSDVPMLSLAYLLGCTRVTGQILGFVCFFQAAKGSWQGAVPVVEILTMSIIKEKVTTKKMESKTSSPNSPNSHGTGNPGRWLLKNSQRPPLLDLGDCRLHSNRQSLIVKEIHLKQENSEPETTWLFEPKLVTPWKFIIAPENGWLEDEFPFGNHHFQVPC